MNITEEKIRQLIRQSLLTEKTIKMSNSYAFTSKTTDDGKNQKYVHRLHQLDPIVRKIAKIMDKEKKKKTGSGISKVLTFLEKCYVKNDAGEKIPIARKAASSRSKDDLYYNILQNYIAFANEYSISGKLASAIKTASLPGRGRGDDLSDDLKQTKSKSVMVKNDPNDPSKGYEVKSAGQDKSDGVITVDFKNAVVDGEKVTGTLNLNDIFKDILAGEKLLKVGSGRSWIKNKKNQTEWMQVKTLQGLLISAGYAEGLFSDTDGDYGSKTKKAVMNMQKDLKVDGKVGRQTAAALNPKITGSKVPITGVGELPLETAKKLGLKEKLNRHQIRNLINETRQDHIQGIKNKLINLRKEQARLLAVEAEYSKDAREMEAMFPDDPYAGLDSMDAAWPTQQQLFAVDDKIHFLETQLKALETSTGGPVINLPRG